MAVKWTRIKKIAKMVILGVMGAISIVLMALFAVKLRQAIVGKVKKKAKWVDGGKGHIYVQREDESWEKVKLPEGVKYKKVVAAGKGVAENKITVEVRHEKTDKRNPGPARDDNALDALRSRVRPDDSGGD